MNYTVLIADDEKLDRKGMRMLLKRSFPEIRTIAEACNGEELVRQAQAYSPDLIIADIEMPGLNGLQALQQLRESGSGVQVIIMTAYGSYQYVKEAVSLHSFEYLEKPAKRERVVTVVRDVLQEVEKSRSQKEEIRRMKDFISEMNMVIRSELMATIESNEADRSQTRRYLEVLELTQTGFIISFQIKNSQILESESPIRQSVSELRFFEEIRSVLREEGLIDGHILNHSMACLVPATAKETAYQTKVWAMSFVEALRSRFSPEVYQSVRIGIGSMVDSAEMFNASYRESLRALYARGGIASICHYDDVIQRSETVSRLNEYEPAIVDAIRACDERRCIRQVRRAFDLNLYMGDIAPLKDQTLESLIYLRHQLSGDLRGRMPEECILPSLLEKIAAMNRAEQLQALYEEICLRLIGAIAEQNADWQNTIVEKAKNIIHSHYCEDISLEGTAETIGVSQYYLSRLFKVKLGVNYSSYLTDLRIRKACILLEKQDLTIREIAERVGFNDPDYLGKVFKKVMGCTISEYRSRK